MNLLFAVGIANTSVSSMLSVMEFLRSQRYATIQAVATTQESQMKIPVVVMIDLGKHRLKDSRVSAKVGQDIYTIPQHST